MTTCCKAMNSACLLGIALVVAGLDAPAFAQAKLGEEKKGTPVVELLEDGTDFFIENLNNNGVVDASVATRNEQSFFSGQCSLAVTPFQRFNMQMPGWNYKIVENPGPNEYRYLRFAWKRTEAPAIMLQLHTRQQTWQRYYAGTPSKEVQAWGPMIRVADEVPRKWEVVTRDLFKDFGPITITGIGLSALDQDGEAYFDHMYLGRTIEDLDEVTRRMAKPVDAVEPKTPEKQTARPRGWLLPSAIVVAVLVFVLAVVLSVIARRRGAAPVVCVCESCGKKLKAKAVMAGKAVKCPQCGKNVSVPEPKELT